MKYREIDHLLLNVNKGSGGAGRSGSNLPALPGPGDSVMVAVGDRGLLNILIHRAYKENQTFSGKTTAKVCDEAGREIIGDAANVIFSYKKIAGINRR
ncbi:MAG: hypothetical protein ACR2PB_02120 [Desulfocapsaceae bacterium]